MSGALGGNLATLLLLDQPWGAASYLQYSLFAWRMIRRQGLPLRQLHDLVAMPDKVAVNLIPQQGGLTSWDAVAGKDAVYLALLAQSLAPRCIFEIGTLHGYTALLFALNTPPETRIYTLDLPHHAQAVSLHTTTVDDSHIRSHLQARECLYSRDPAGSKVVQLYGDSAQFDFSPFLEGVDLFLIDGAHSYEYVRSDTSRALACMRPGGMCVWHDYGRWGVNGVSRWLHELRASGTPVCRLPGSSLAVLRVRGR